MVVRCQAAKKESQAMPNSEARSPDAAGTAARPATPREHSQIAAEGTDGLEMPEIRMHSQDAAEGADTAG